MGVFGRDWRDTFVSIISWKSDRELMQHVYDILVNDVGGSLLPLVVNCIQYHMIWAKMLCLTELSYCYGDWKG